MKKNTVWVVWVNQYSDDGIAGIFSSQEKAQKAIENKMIKVDRDYRLEPVVLDLHVTKFSKLTKLQLRGRV